MTLPKKETEVEGRISPTVVVLESASPWAIAFGRYPSFVMASSTLFFVSSFTIFTMLFESFFYGLISLTNVNFIIYVISNFINISHFFSLLLLALPEVYRVEVTISYLWTVGESNP